VSARIRPRERSERLSGGLARGRGAIVALSTAGTAEEADRLVKALVTDELVACGTVIGPVTSTYRWKGELCVEPEHMILLKTRRDRLQALIARLRTLHSYECPELLALPVEAGYRGYLEWLFEGTGGARRRRPARARARAR
jgi:periplasmic divalent cation tolerance protein